MLSIKINTPPKSTNHTKKSISIHWSKWKTINLCTTHWKAKFLGTI